VVLCEVFKDNDHELTYLGTALGLSTASSAFYALPFGTPQSCLSISCDMCEDDGHKMTYTGTAPCLSTAPSAFHALPFDTPRSCLSILCDMCEDDGHELTYKGIASCQETSIGGFCIATAQSYNAQSMMTRHVPCTESDDLLGYRQQKSP